MLLKRFQYKQPTYFLYSIFLDSFTIQIKTAVAPTNKSLEIDWAAGLAFANEIKFLMSKLFPYSIAKSKFAIMGRIAPRIDRKR